MERSTKAKIGNTEFQMIFTVSVMMDAQETFGDLGIIQATTGQGRDAFKNRCWLISEMANAAKALGADQPTISAETLQKSIMPFEQPEIDAAFIKALELGYMREIEDKGEVDLGLVELQKKKELTK